MRILIKNGTLITAEEEYASDVLIDGEKIAVIGENLSGIEEIKKNVDEIIDATGKYVMPGMIDQHVHYSFVYKGSKVRGFETTAACAVGGTTSVVEFVNQVNGKGLIESLENYKKESCDGISMVDYSLHPVVTDARPEVIDEIPSIAKYGYTTMKLFMAYKGQSFHADDETILKALIKSKEAGITVMVHAENADMVDYLTKKLVSEGKTAPFYHAVSRPPIVEAEATSRAIYLSRVANAPIYIVHVTCKDALDVIKEAKKNGYPVNAETCAHYLLFDEDKLALPNDEGAKFVCSPALRKKEHQEYLWKGINDGTLNAISSDHCGFDFKYQKHLGIGDGLNFSDIPNGAPSAQYRCNAIWTYGVCTGKISKQKFVEVMSTNPAKNNGLKSKGHLLAGYDADIVIFDPNYKGIMTVKESLEGVDYSIYEGMEQKGRPETVLLRGKVVVRDGKYVGNKGDGKFIFAKV